MTFLIVYESVPEDTFIYLVETEDLELIAEIRLCHGQFVGLVDCPELVGQTIAKLDSVGKMIYDSTAEPTLPPTIVGKVEVIVTGFIM